MGRQGSIFASGPRCYNGIVLVLAVWSAYALSGAGVIDPLATAAPSLVRNHSGLSVAGAVRTVRAGRLRP